ncbi:hypothetical protein K3495_g120 [Podosphaera aphanis]|nr:hypothetical protein K3495_g120 [Podosphaera aphanis]
MIGLKNEHVLNRSPIEILEGVQCDLRDQPSRPSSIESPKHQDNSPAPTPEEEEEEEEEVNRTCLAHRAKCMEGYVHGCDESN